MARIINIIFLFALLPCVAFGFGGDEKKKSKTSYSKKAKFLFHYLDSAKHYRFTDVSKSYDFIEKSLRYAIKTNDSELESESYQLLGEINLSLKKLDDAETNLLKSLNISESNALSNVSYKNYALLGETYLKMGDYDESLRYYYSYMGQAKMLSNSKDVITALIQTAIIYERQKKYDKAIVQLKEAYSLSKSMKIDKKLALIIDNQMAEILVLQQKDDEALALLNQKLNDSSSVESKEVATENIAKILEKENRYEEILELRNELLEQKKAENDIPGLVKDYQKISDVYLRQNEWEKAIPILEEKVKLASELKDDEELLKGYENLSRAYKGAGKDQLALESYEKFAEFNDKISKRKKKEASEQLVLAEKINAKQRRIDLLEKDKKITSQQLAIKDQEIKQQNIITYSLIAVLLIVISGSILLYRSSQQKKIANQLLALKSLRSQMNPHFIFNALNSVNSFIAKNDERSANKYLSDFSKLMRQVMENSKYDLVSLESELQILEKYIKLEHFRFSDKFDYHFEIGEDIDVEDIQIPPMLVQPYIENAVWHGLRYLDKKGKLKVELRKEKKGLRFIISDNGIGRKKSQEVKTKNQKETKSTGMENIEHRLNIINDVNKMELKVEVEDLDKENETGTVVSILIPINHD